MQFHVNHPILYVMAGLLVAVVLSQSVYFLIKALRRAKAIGMDMSKLGKTIRSADTLAEIIPDFHNTPVRFEALRAAVEQDAAGRRAEVEDEKGHVAWTNPIFFEE